MTIQSFSESNIHIFRKVTFPTTLGALTVSVQGKFDLSLRPKLYSDAEHILVDLQQELFRLSSFQAHS